jgi:CRP-like cAMP-binding protein
MGETMTTQEKDWEMHITEMDLFTGLNLEVMAEIADKCCTEVTYTQDTIIFKQGDPAGFLYVLVEGTVDLRLREEKTIISLNEKSDLFGWSSLVENAEYTASAVCRSTVKAIQIETGPKLGRILNAHPEFGLILYRRLAALFNKRLSNIYQKFQI